MNDFLVFAGSCRFVYNKGLALINENYDSGKKFLNYNQLASELVNWKNEECLAWLKMAPSQCLQQSLRDLDRAFKNF
ncbi:helix-turn-helix domain-containing protein, partial [Enterobacter hormaechei]|nr:helix-turn-helix domain-containing protein [Enterobacter hormaechei]